GTLGDSRYRPHTCSLPNRRRCRLPGFNSFAAHWLAYALPCRRFADTLAGACARLGADAVRYSFIVADFHHLLLAGFTGAPAVVCHGGTTPLCLDAWRRENRNPALAPLNTLIQGEDAIHALRSPHLHTPNRSCPRVRGALREAPGGAPQAFEARCLLAHRVRTVKPSDPRLSL